MRGDTWGEWLALTGDCAPEDLGSVISVSLASYQRLVLSAVAESGDEEGKKMGGKIDGAALHGRQHLHETL